MKHKVIVLVESALDEMPGDRCVHIAQRAEEWEAEFVVSDGPWYIYPYLAVRLFDDEAHTDPLTA